MSILEDRVANLLERVVKLLTILVIKGLPDKEPTRKEQILMLSSVGLKPKEIAELLGTTPNTVSVALSTARKQTSNKGTKGEK